jgi:hypothetical protein
MTYGPRLSDLTSAELRLELAEAEASRSRTIRAKFARKDRIRDITRELVARGAF